MDRRLNTGANVFAIAFSKEPDTLLGICSDRTLRHWDTTSSAVRRSVSWPEGEGSAILTAAGVITVGKEGLLTTWDLQSGKVLRRLAPPGPVSRKIAAPPDGRLVLGNIRMKDDDAETHIRMWDAGGRERFTLPSGLGGIGGFAVSPDGYTAVAASYDADLRAWSVRNGELLRHITSLPVSMFDLKFSPDGRQLAAAGADRTVYLFDTKTWNMTGKLPIHPEMISALAYSPDGRRLAAGGFSELTQKLAVKVIVHDVAGGRAVRTVDAPHRVASLAFSPDGQTLAVAAGEKYVELWQIPA